jgi:hypothetical protein
LAKFLVADRATPTIIVFVEDHQAKQLALDWATDGITPRTTIAVN